MTSFIHLSAAILFAICLASPAHALDTAKARHDLVFGLGDPAQPFFQGGTFMLGDQNIKVEQGALPKTEMVSYDAQAQTIIVNDDKTIAEADKGAALLQLMDTLSIQAIEPAAGQ